ncbi:MAG: molecular chaperone [Casimicrobiaceae bacterium]
MAPIGLEFTPASPAQGLWLTNTGDRELRAQARVFHWTQVDGKDELAPTQALVASPPMLSLAPGGRQLVRVIRTGGSAPAGAGEDAFRVLIDELPQAEQAQNSSLQYVLRYSVPVFIGGANPPDETVVGAALHWSLVHEGSQVMLEVRNAGAYHAQISDVSLLPASGEAIVLSPGLLGYALPGMTMHWPLKPPANAAGADVKLKARINGKSVDQVFAVGDLPR